MDSKVRQEQTEALEPKAGRDQLGTADTGQCRGRGWSWSGQRGPSKGLREAIHKKTGTHPKECGAPETKWTERLNNLNKVQ